MSDNATETAAPSLKGLNPPPFVTSDEDHAGILMVVSALLMTWMALCAIIRSYLRSAVNGPFGVDDYTLLAGTLVGMAQTFTIFASISNGLGKALPLIDEAKIGALEQSYYASDLLYLLANALAKCSVALLLARLTRTRVHLTVCYAITALSAVWGFASMLAVALRCQLSEPWATYNRSCPNLLLRWQLVTAVDVADEVALFAIAVWLVWALQMPRRLKATVILAFALRLPVIAASLARLADLGFAYGSAEPFFDIVPAGIATQCALHYSLMAATIPCMKPFIISFNTSWGTTNPRGTSYALDELSYGSRDRDRGAGLSYVPANHSVVSQHGGEERRGSTKRTMASPNKPRGSVGQNIGVALSLDSKLRPEAIGHSTYVGKEQRGKGDAESMETDGSQQMIIRKTEDYTVRYDDGSAI